jgi:hypothetical protein
MQGADTSMESINGGRDRKRILAVTRKSGFSPSAMDRTVSVAARLGHDLVAVYVRPFSEGESGDKDHRRFVEAARRNALSFQACCEGRTHFDHVITEGRIADAIRSVIRERRRVEFVVVGPELAGDGLREEISSPVFTLEPQGGTAPQDSGPRLELEKVSLAPVGGNGLSKEKNHRGGSMETTNKKRNKLGRTVLFGTLTAGFYAGFFALADPVMSLTKQGGIYALIPVATVFLCSYVHGTFASELWSALGLEASKTIILQPTESKARQVRRKDTRPRATLSV